MENFPKYYTRLFNGITDAIEALQAQNYIKAQDILIQAQQDAEEMYLEDVDEDDEVEDDAEYVPFSVSIPLLAEIKRLELQSLIHESDEAFRELMQEKEARSEGPPPGLFPR